MLPAFTFFNAHATDANNVGTERLKWVKRFENFIVACGITDDTREMALLLHYVGEDVYDTYCALPDLLAAAAASAISSTDDTTPLYIAARRRLNDYFAPRVNTAFKVYNFRQAKQIKNKSLDASYTRLCQLEKHCAFVDADIEIKNEILLSTASRRLRRDVMQHDIDLQGILKEARLFEEVEYTITVMEQEHQQSKENAASTLAVNPRHKSQPH